MPAPRYHIHQEPRHSVRDINPDYIDENAVLPDPYGSRQDPNYTDITQLHDNERVIPLVTDSEANAEFVDVISPQYMYQPEPKFRVFQFNISVPIGLSQALPFKARALRVDNLTNQWLFIPSLRIFIPPNWFAAVFPLSGLQQINVLFQPPPNILQPAPVIGSLVQFVAHFERMPYVAGVQVF